MKSKDNNKTKLILTDENLIKLKLESKILNEELDQGVLLIDQIHKKREILLEKIEKEYRYQESLKSKINYLKSEYGELNKVYKENFLLLEDIKEKNIEIEKNLKSLERKSENKNIIKNNFPALMDEIRSRKAFPRESSILLNCIQLLIETTLENEFSDVEWKSVIDHSSKTLGGRILFEKLSMQYLDAKNLYSPVIKQLEQKFNRSKLQVQTNISSSQGIAYKIDFVIRIPLQINQKRLELP